MKAISLWQPWAEAIRIKKKTVETRHWRYPTSLNGQTIAIHAAKRQISRIELEDFRDNPDWDFIFNGQTDTIRPLHYGGIVATARLIRAERTYDLIFARWIEPQATYGDYSSGRWGWILGNIKPVKFVPVVGRQGFFDVPDNLITEL